MSVLDKLNELQETRQNKYSQALQKSPVELAQSAASAPVPETIQLQFGIPAWMLKTILVLLVITVLELGFLIGMVLKNSRSAKKAIAQSQSLPQPEIKPPGKYTAAPTENPVVKSTSKTTKTTSRKKRSSKSSVNTD